MKTESLRAVKNNLSRVIDGLRRTGPVLITKNGRTRAVLLPVGPDTDLESLLLSQNERLWELIDLSVSRAKRGGLTPFKDLPEWPTSRPARATRMAGFSPSR